MENGDIPIPNWFFFLEAACYLLYRMFDELDGKFIIEWSRALNGYDETTEETFQVILYNQNSMATVTEDGVIDFQYLEIEDVDVTKNYSTVGIEAPLKNYGLQYAFNNVYASGAALLEDGRAIRFSTNSPDNYISELSLNDNINPQGFEIENAYPNPFNGKVKFDFSVDAPELVTFNVYDINGRMIVDELIMSSSKGYHQVSWDGRNRHGDLVSSGVYYYTFTLPERVVRGKITYLK